MRGSSWLVVLILVCLVGALGTVGRMGCRQIPPSGKTVVRYCQWSGARQQTVVWKLKEIFEAQHPDIEIALEFYPRNYWSKLYTMIAAGIGPDVLFISPPHGPDMARKGLLEDLAPYIERDKLDANAYYNVIMRSFQYKGKQYALPMQFGSIALFYNKDLFDRAGVPYPKDDWTWEDLLKTAQALTIDSDSDGRPEQYGLLLTQNREVCIYNFIGQAGGDVLDPTCTRCVIDSPEAIEALQFIVDLHAKHKVIPGMTSGSEGITMTSFQGFEAGRVAMAYDGSWMMDNYNRSGQLNYDVAALPHYRRPWVTATGLANAINARSKVKEAAWEWVKFYAGEEAQQLLGEYKRGIPVMKRVARSSAFLNEKQAPENERVFLDQMEYAHDLYPTPSWLEWDQAAQDEIGCALTQVKPVDQALRDLTTTVNRILERAEGDGQF